MVLAKFSMIYMHPFDVPMHFEGFIASKSYFIHNKSNNNMLDRCKNVSVLGMSE